MTQFPPPPEFGMPMGGYSTEKNKLGVWALVLGIASILCCGIFAGVPAIITGVMGRNAANEGRATNGSMATVGMVLGIVGVGLSILGGILAATGVIDYSFSTSSN